MNWIVVAALTAQVIGIYLVWPSRWNVPAHLSLGFSVTAYIIPGLLTNVWDAFDQETVDLYAQINVCGATFLILGLVLGGSVSVSASIRDRLRGLLLSNGNLRGIQRRAELVAIFAIIGLLVSYWVMGFVPMFAADPLAAKQFKGPYHEPYYRAAYLFRFCFSVIVVVLPILLTSWWVGRRARPFVLSVSGIGVLTVSLARAASATGALTFLGVVAAKRTWSFLLYLPFVAVIYPIGSAAYLFVGFLTGESIFASIYSVSSVFDIVASGAPDIADQLTFLQGFMVTEPFTYGRTFLGGLVPGNYMWNPSVWTLTYDSVGADISDVISGGLRLTTAMWGYANFGWFGVCAIPFLSGFVNGVFMKVLRELPMARSLIGAMLVLMIYMTLGKQLSEFYLLSIHNIPAIAAVLVISFWSARIVWANSSGCRASAE